jgi:hypothetical protein
MNDKDLDTRPSSGDRRPDNACLRCGSTISSDGIHEFRTGGSTGATHFFLGQWAELGEDKVTLEVYVCRQCRHVELRSPE